MCSTSLNRSGAVVCRNRERLGDVRVQRTREGGHAHQLQELTPIVYGSLKLILFFSCAVRKAPVGDRRHAAVDETRETLSQADDAAMN